MRDAAQDFINHPDLYCEYGARLDVVARICWQHHVANVPVVGFIEELGWMGPVVIGVCTDRDALLACWSRHAYPFKNKPQNICIQSVMQRDIYSLYDDRSSRWDLDRGYAGILDHYRAHH